MSISEDRFTRGWISGTCGGFIGAIFGLLFKYIGISKLCVSDWAAILIFGRTPPFSILDHLYAILILAGTVGVVGIIFAYLLPLINDENIYFKGLIIFTIPWWFIFLLSALAKLEGTLNLSVKTTLANGLSIAIMAFLAVYIYRRLEPKNVSE